MLEKTIQRTVQFLYPVKGEDDFFLLLHLCIINLSKVKREYKCCLEYNCEVNVLMKQNYGKLFPRDNVVKCVTGEGWKYKLVLMFKLCWMACKCRSVARRPGTQS